MADDKTDDTADNVPADDGSDEQEQPDAADEQAAVDTDDSATAEDMADTGEDADESAGDVPQPGADEPGTDEEAADPFASEDSLVERLLQFHAEDWLVIVLLVALVVTAVAAYVPLQTLFLGTGNQTVDRSTNPYCLDTVKAVEGNLTRKVRGEVDCTCLKPTDPNDPTLGPRANNTYTIQCEYPDGRKQNFQIWVPNEEYQNMTNGTPQIRR